ncbi:MAG: vitamin B12 dependent-methionine synthase activation domain-containing protein [Bacteroidales bacterium]|jgi:hypothetical protein|nr:vitamin B12 dependent-methionine synthase activation domain-containing protein [Bacteroidales bacterium]
MCKLNLSIDIQQLKITVEGLEAVMGYREGEDRSLVTPLITDVLTEAREICPVKAEYMIFNDIQFDDSDRSLLIGSVRFHIGRIIFSHLRKAEAVALFLCTAGDEIGGRIRKYMSGVDLLKGYVYDVAGSEIVEAAADLIQEKLRISMKEKGLAITNRFSPGYCGWDVSEQHKLFSLHPENFCGITLTDSALMQPVKSVSGIIGIGKGVKFNPYSCSICDSQNCIYRNKK